MRSIGHNVRTEQEVDNVMRQAERAGATIVKPAEKTSWGGYAGYFADPDGQLLGGGFQSDEPAGRVSGEGEASQPMRLKRRMPRHLRLVLVPIVGACDILGIGVVCESYAAPGISVTLMDSETHGPVLAGNAVVVARQGAFADTMTFVIEPSLYNVGVGLAYERTGTYRVEVLVTGYESWAMVTSVS